jgi:NADH-quinone oxidoreductase subunit L
MTDFRALALIPLAPLLGAVYNGLLGSRMQARFGKPAVHIPAVALPAISFAVTVAAFAKMVSLPAEERSLFCHLWNWLPVGGLDAGLAFIMDPLTLVMCFVVTFVGTLIHVYSIGYMRDEPGYWRFFSYLNLFMFSMLVLVLGDNFVLMFVGWEGVGLCSYLLISFWYKEHKNAVAGMKAFIVNRIGDFGFMLGVFLLFWGMQGDWSQGRFQPQPVAASAGAVSAQQPESSVAAPAAGLTFRNVRERLTDPAFREAFIQKKVFGISLVALIGTLLFIGAMGKSAQLPLYVWLPDAMAGPTPVSALIHAATMVTAGVYMVARLNFIFALSPFVMTWIAVIGVLTAVFAATIGFFQHDIKKVLAYSTISQLGFMFIAVGVGAYGVGIFHLMTHAFFKACLFLGAGSVIVGCHHEQDMRKMGGLKKLMPVTAATYFIACCAIAGFPLTSGFFSKDEILWKAFNAGNLILPGGGIAVWVLGALAAVGTSFYMFRSYYMTFSGEYRGADRAHDRETGAHAEPHHAPKESPRSMTVVLIALAALSLIGGLAGLPELWHLPNCLQQWLEPVFAGTAGLIRDAGHGASAEWALMALSIGLALTGWQLARWLYLDNRNPIPQKLYASRTAWVHGIHTLVYNKYYVDEIYNATVVKAVMQLRLALDWFDRTVVDGLVNVTRPIVLALAWLHGKTDSHVVDGAVNGTASMISDAGGVLCLLQTGNIRTYLYVAMAGGIVLILASYVLF